MGALVYAAQQEIEFEDRLLTHLQIVIGSKLRRREGFYLSWSEESAHGNAQTTIWIDATIPLMFRYERTAPSTINRSWLETLNASANSSRGLVVTNEAIELATAGPAVTV